MRDSTLICLLLAATLPGCPGGGGAIGDHCASHGDCSSDLQCLSSVCVPRCQRAPDCGDGFACDSSGLCIAATGQTGDRCKSEVDCVAGLSCQIEGSTTDENGQLLASCVTENSARPAGAECRAHGECRNGTCDLGHCVDLCSDTRDCGASTSCTNLPHVDAGGIMFHGCLQSRGALSWEIPIKGPIGDVLLPIPESARSVSVLFTVEDQSQKVGATNLVAPSGVQLLSDQYTYYTNPFVRHRAEFGQSVLALPSTPAHPLQPGVYAARVKSLRPRPDPNDPTQIIDQNGTATPTMTAVVKLDSSVILDLHFYFLNFDDHPCAAAFAGNLDAATAQTAKFFQDDFLGPLRSVFGQGGVALGTITYKDLREHPDLDGLDQQNVASLLSLGDQPVGINVFFVRTLSPVGLQAIGPNPGPAGLANTRQSGIVIGLDTLCYRNWTELSRLTARELARYMGLYSNIEQDSRLGGVVHYDPISDSDTSSSNLMFYSELGGTSLSPGQGYVLSRSAVLR